MFRPQAAPTILALFCVLTSSVSSQDASFKRFGSGCAGIGSVSSLDAAEGNLPRIGETFQLEFSDLPASASPFGLIGLLGFSKTEWAGEALPLDLSPFGITGCTLFVSVARTDLLLVNGASGRAGWTLHVDDEPSLIGARFYAQGLVFDPSANPAGFVLSNAAEGVVGANAGPEATIIFPTKVASTDAKSIIVRGTAFDPSGVAEVRVNGRLAASGDGYRNWQVRVPLPRGFTDLIVETRDSLGHVSSVAAQAHIESQEDMSGPSAIASDLTRNRALVVDNDLKTILAIDLDTGDRDPFSGDLTGSGPELLNPTGIALDLSGNRALVTDSRLSAVLSIDLITGDREILSDNNRGVGLTLGNVQAVALDGARALIVSVGPNNPGGKLIAVDLATGDRRVVSDEVTGQGVPMGAPVDIAIEGTRAFVVDTFRFDFDHLGRIIITNNPSLISVDLSTGDRSYVSGMGIGTGPEFVRPARVVIDGPRGLVVDPGLSAIIAVDLATGDRTILSSSIVGSGPNFSGILGIALEGRRAITLSSGAAAILSVDLVSGDREYLSRDSRVGGGVPFGTISGLVHDDGRLLALQPKSIIAVDLATGDRSVVSSPILGTGIEFTSPSGLALTGGRAIVTNKSVSTGVILSVDLATGDRSVLSDPNHGSGPAATISEGVAIDGTRALVTTSLSNAVLSVDLTTGDRTVISKFDVGSGPIILPRAIVLDGGRAIVVSLNPEGLVAIDLQSGNRTVISSASVASGPLLGRDTPIANFGANIVAANVGVLLEVNLESGNRRVLSGKPSGTPGDPLGMGPRIQNFGGAMTVIGSVAFATEGRLRAIVAVDLLTGERVICAQ